jgi:hypothetical protein
MQQTPQMQPMQPMPAQSLRLQVRKWVLLLRGWRLVLLAHTLGWAVQLVELVLVVTLLGAVCFQQVFGRVLVQEPTAFPLQTTETLG